VKGQGLLWRLILACVYAVAESDMWTIHAGLPWLPTKVLLVYEFSQEVIDVLEVARLSNSVVVTSVR
jgi:hypothetical protein